MAADFTPKPSFSPHRRWGNSLHLALLIALVFSVVVMVNYLARDYRLRLHLDSLTRTPLSSRTVKFLATLTNEVTVIVYYDKDEPFFNTVVDLLNEYNDKNGRILVKIVDYKRDAGAAQELKAKYAFLANPAAKNLVIFDCNLNGNHRVKPVEGNALMQYVTEQVPNENEIELRRKPVFFEGERAFTSTLLEVTSPKSLKAYFVTGHGEHAIDTVEKEDGYGEFVKLLRELCVTVEPPLSLANTNPVPRDCNLLVIAGPRERLDPVEAEKIEQYLREGGRMLALFGFPALRRGETGLERILARWGVDVGFNVIIDPDNHYSQDDLIVREFNSSHPVVNPLLHSKLQMVLPRSVGKLGGRLPAVEALHVEELAFSGPKAWVKGDPKHEPHTFPLMVAVEKGAIKGVITERGTTRLVVTGDSFFLDNQLIVSGPNRDFGALAINWLLDRPQLLEGIGPRPVNLYKIIMTRTQLQSAEWLLLGAMPGGALLLGSLVWLRRRR